MVSSGAVSFSIARSTKLARQRGFELTASKLQPVAITNSKPKPQPRMQ
ncbi:MAG: hypothetical protein HC849_04300 [Oscillatoriales cyanobacterium RU_3_3]|nr:hypothetical protein [Oscillatoriales cyanobacterium RU_3_3]